MVHEIRIDRILKVPALVVRKQNVDGFRSWFAAIGTKFRARLRRYAMVYRMDDVRL